MVAAFLGRTAANAPASYTSTPGGDLPLYSVGQRRELRSRGQDAVNNGNSNRNWWELDGYSGCHERHIQQRGPWYRQLHERRDRDGPIEGRCL